MFRNEGDSRDEKDDKKQDDNCESNKVEIDDETAMRQILQNGYCVLESFINEESCDKLRNYLLSKYNENKSDLSYNYFDGHYQTIMASRNNQPYG